jgi:hypothetical protein
LKHRFGQSSSFYFRFHKEHSYSDVRLQALARAKRAKVNVNEFVIEDVHSQFGFQFKVIQSLLERFSQLDVQQVF